MYALVDDVENLVALYDYDAWGNILTQAVDDSTDNDFTFSTREFSALSGLGHWPIREYDPFIGRWSRVDDQGWIDGGNMYAFVGNNTVNSIDKLGQKKCKCGEKITVVWAVGPLDAWKAKAIAEKARKIAKKEGRRQGWPPKGAADGEIDAFRHCYWSCEMTKAIGAKQAKKVGDIHEVCNPNSPAEHAMDLHNNRMGRKYGKKRKSCRKSCADGVNNGKLIIKPGGSARPGY